MANDAYRPLSRPDCGAVALNHNRNLDAAEPLWCATGRRRDAGWVWRHRLALLIWGRGGLISQVHERDGRFVSYFGGYTRGPEATFSIGIVDLDLPDPWGAWRRDSARVFESTLAAGAQLFRLKASSDRGWFVGWAEQEVGMRRLPGQRTWVADRATIAGHVGGFVLLPADGELPGSRGSGWPAPWSPV